MINTAELVDALVEKLRAIPELVMAMGGDPTAIYAYQDHYPKRVKRTQAIHDAPHPSILVMLDATVRGSFGPAGCWQHELRLYIRAGEDLEDARPYDAIRQLIVNGIPEDSTVRLSYQTIHAACDPMDVSAFRWVTDEEGIDHWVAFVSFRELADT